MPNQTSKTFQKESRDKFAGGVNSYLGVRQIEEDESPDMNNCDFKGKGGIGNRQGYDQIGSADATNNDGVVGMGALHTSTLHQLLRFAKNGSTDVKLEYSTGGAWTQVADTFAVLNIDGCQAAKNFYVGNGSDVMKHWTGAAWATTTNGTKGYWPTYYSRRLWVVDEEEPDRLNFSGQWGAAGGEDEIIGAGGAAGATADKLGDFTDASSGWISFKYGSGAEITGIKVFKDNLYVFLRDSIYKVTPATAANTFYITQITNSVGCVSHRSIAQVEEDLFFAGDDGVYALGEVANYVSVRTTNKSAKIQGVFNNLSAINKAKLVGAYHNFKYHLFFSEGGTVNDTVVAYDVRYQAWTHWSNMSANSATLYVDANNDKQLYFGHPTTSCVYKMYSGTTDDGTVISSYWTSKSFDEDLPDTLKVYFDHTFIFGLLNGEVGMRIIFDDNEIYTTESISQVRPTGGMGASPFGRKPFGVYTNTITTINDYRGVPLRLRASDKKFAVQYKITSEGDWRLDNITTTFKSLGHFAFISNYQIN